MKSNVNQLYVSNNNIELKIFWTQCISLFILELVSSVVLNTINFDLTRLILEIVLILFTATIFMVSFKTKKLNPYRYIMLLLCNLFIIALFLLLNGISRITIFSYFTLNILFTVILFNKIERIIYVVIECILYSVNVIYLVTLKDSNVIIYNMLIQMIISTCTIVACFLNILKIHENNAENLQDINNKLKNVALKDSLTNLWNRDYMNDLLDEIIEQQSNLSIIMMDIDHFKKINDTYGHLVGDKVLKKFANILKNSIPKNASAIRYGGEEFLIILPEKNAKEASLIADNIRTKVQNNLKVKEIKDNITISGGVREYNRKLTKTTLINEADKNLYVAKESGRNRIVV